MVDRIDKSTRVEEYWKIQSSTHTKKDKGRDPSKDEFSGFQEKTDWNLLFDKSKLWKKNIQIQGDEIERILFQKINLKTDPSLLRVDILLHGGNEISPAFLAISRAEGLRIKNLNPGDEIEVGLLLKNNALTVTMPTNPELFKKNEFKSLEQPAESYPESEEEGTVKSAPWLEWGTRLKLLDPASRRIRLEIAFIYGISFLILLMLVWGYFLLS